MAKRIKRTGYKPPIPDRVGDERRKRDPRTIYEDMDRARRAAQGRDGGIAAWDTPSRIPERNYGESSRGGWRKPSQGLADNRERRRSRTFRY